MKNNWVFLRWSLVALMLLLAIVYIDWPSVLGVLSLLHLVALLVVQPIQFFVIYLLAVRLAMLCQGHVRGIRPFIEAYILSVGLNSFLPGRLSELVKVTYLREKAGVSAPICLSGIFLEKITDVFFLSLIAMLGIGTIWIEVNQNIALAGIAGSLILLIVIPRLEILLISIIKKLPAKKYHSVFQSMVTESVSRIKSKEIYKALYLSGLIWLASFALVYVVLKLLLGPEINLESALLIFVAMAVGRAIPGLPGSIGTFEAAVVFAMVQLGFEFYEALATAFTLHASQIAIVTIVSMLVLGRSGTGVHSLILRLKELNGNN